MNCEQYQESQKTPEEHSLIDKAKNMIKEGKGKFEAMKLSRKRIVRTCPYCNQMVSVGNPGLAKCSCGFIFCTECNLANNFCKCKAGTKK
mmetsp:Transcript_7238/g.7092  ORF Transcript_7238/g.7092 Transcript_7238/m.7092 type:complete len:90 (+) Transcript_7238:414-683(+)